MSLTFADKHSNRVNWLKERPIAHRGLHDVGQQIWENTLSAAAASLRRDYPIELDLQPSADWVPMVFHDEKLERMTGVKGNIREYSAKELSKLRIKGTEDIIPTLSEFLDLVRGDVGIVIELKGKEGADAGFVDGVLKALEGYEGDFALMSFEHHIVEEIRKSAPSLPLGLTAYGENDQYETHRAITESAQVDFISYHYKSLETRFVSEFREAGRPVICWTIKNQQDEEYSRKYSDQPTFENYLA